MDSLLRDCIPRFRAMAQAWLPAWRALARAHGVRLTVLSDYAALADWAARQDETRRVAVVYVNGCFRFSEASCRTPDARHIQHEQAAAGAFWRWCASHAVSPARNHLYGGCVAPRSALTWQALADSVVERGLNGGNLC